MPPDPPRVIIDFYSASNLLCFCHTPKETACTKVWGAPHEEISRYVPGNNTANEES